MRILLLCTNAKKAASPRTITALKHVYAHYIGLGLKRRGCELHYMQATVTGISLADKQRIVAMHEVPEVDHVLCCEQDILSHHLLAGDDTFYRPLRQHTSGLLTSVRDRPRDDSVSDILFTAVGTRGIPGNVWIGAAVDPAVFVSRQTEVPLTICLDYAKPNPQGVQYHEGLARQCEQFVAGNRDAKLIRLPDRTTQRKLANALAVSHIFVATHPESFGMTIVEAGVAGCLVVARRGFVHEDILRYVDHVDYDDEIPWSQVLDRVDPVGCRETAMATSNRWNEVVDIVYDTLQKA